MADIPANIEANVHIKKFEIDPAVQKQLDEMIAIGKAGPSGGEAAKELPAAIMTNVEAMNGLEKVMKGMLGNSKIVNTFAGLLAKSMGLLVDVILMPFLPIFVWVMVGIFKIIMAFYKIWKEIWDSKHIQTISEWLKKLAKHLSEGISGLFKLGVEFLNAVGQKIFDFLIWVWENGKLAFDFVVGAITGFLKWLWDTFVEAGKAASLSIGFIVDTVSEFLVWVWQVASGIGNFITMNLNLGTIAAFITKMLDLATNGLHIAVNFVESGSAAASAAIGNVVNSIGMGLGLTPDIKTGLAKGGTVSETGFAKVHEGETIVPKGGGVTVNISGQFKSDEDMYRRFVDRLRQEQWRTNV